MEIEMKNVQMSKAEYEKSRLAEFAGMPSPRNRHAHQNRKKRVLNSRASYCCECGRTFFRRFAQSIPCPGCGAPEETDDRRVTVRGTTRYWAGNMEWWTRPA